MQPHRHVQFVLDHNTYQSPPSSFSSSSGSPPRSLTSSSSSTTSSSLTTSSSSSSSSISSDATSSTISSDKNYLNNRSPQPNVFHLTTPSPIIIQLAGPEPLLPTSPVNILSVVHPLLSTLSGPTLFYDLRLPPSLASSFPLGALPRAFREPATTPASAAISIVSPHFPWVIPVHPANGAYVVVHDVLRAIYDGLQQCASRTEYRAWLPTSRLRRRATRAYEARCQEKLDIQTAIPERQQGLKRVDFLPAFRLWGIEPVMEEPFNLWWLRVY
ncbi:hypothetical protein BD626DRAFT_402878 [Schizophyllum amplum]|uniref:DUF6699 domain-containing protein n=1 Tax=Schizophyllum amplum TaxID=97359 RepID=A0A550CET5_9AGAR|nr:hypothetical protein BD626DRAFT_402878 [Auriculariopsis ampla]